MIHSFTYNFKKFRNKIFFKNFFIIFINFSILVWTFLHVDPDKKNLFLLLAIGFIVFLTFFLIQSYKQQKELFAKRTVEFKDHLLQIFTSSGECSTINLKRVSRIEKDYFNGFTRYSILENDEPYQIINILDEKQFEATLIEKSKTEIITLKIDWKDWILKSFLFFLPALIGAGFSYLKLIPIAYFYLILTINGIFFMIHFSEKRKKNGFNASTVRRVVFLLIILLVYQFLNLY